MRIVLKGGPLDGQRETVSEETATFSTRADNCRVVYDDSGETDPATGLRIFAYRPASGEEGEADGE